MRAEVADSYFHGMLEDPQLGEDILGDQIDKFLRGVLRENRNEDFSQNMQIGD